MGDESASSWTPMIRVGLKLVKPEELGFEKVITKRINVLDSDDEDDELYIYVLFRHDVPLVIVSPETTITLHDFTNAYTAGIDYPTLPFVIASAMLKRQKEKYFKCMKRNTDCKFDYILDVIGLLSFALHRRGEDACVDIKVDWERKGWKHHIPGLECVKQAICRASDTQPYLGNRRYIDIACDMYQLLEEIAEKLKEDD